MNYLMELLRHSSQHWLLGLLASGFTLNCGLWIFLGLRHIRDENQTVWQKRIKHSIPAESISNPTEPRIAVKASTVITTLMILLIIAPIAAYELGAHRRIDYNLTKWEKSYASWEAKYSPKGE